MRRSPPFRLPALVWTVAILAAGLPSLAAAQRSEEPNPRALERAREMARERASAEEVAREMQRAFRLTSGQTVVVLHQARYSAPQVATATSSTFRIGPDVLARYMASAGVSPEVTARALHEGLRLPHREVAVSLRDGIELPPDGIESALRVAGASPQIAQDALRFAGLLGPPPPPGIQRYWIRDYRPGAPPGAIIENEGVLDRWAISFHDHMTPDDTDGEVWIEGEALDMPDTEVFTNVHGNVPEPGEILERTREGGLDRLRVRFERVPGPGLMVRHSGGEVIHDASPLFYYVVLHETLAEPLEGLGVRLGDPEGEGELRVGGQSLTFELLPFRQSGLEVILTGVRSDPCSVDTDAAPNGAAMVVAMPFREDGRQFRGHLAAYIPVWTCETFEVPQAQCGFLDIPCFLDFLGQTFTSLGTCGNWANWEEHEVLDLPGAPFEGDLSNASLEIRMEVAPDGSGRLASQNDLYDFQASISVVGPTGGDVSLSAIEGYLTGTVTQAIASGMQDLDLAGQLANAVNTAADQAAGALGWNLDIRGVSPLGGGRLFLDLAR